MSRELELVEESQLVERALAKDREAFGELMIRYEASLRSVVFGVVGDLDLARDVTQDTFLRAFKFLDRYHRQFRFSTWLFRIGVNLGISRLRRHRLENDVFSESGVVRYGLDRRGTNPVTPVDTMVREERARQILSGVRELSERYRNVLLLRYKDGLSCREIGDQLGISPNSVSIILHRSKLKLKEFLGEEVS
ncbi:MAG: RNA polymerase sigma factor [Salinibacterium sp.]|nr:RNA polymerase sigma factor [Salinibacterium sp.]